MGINIPEIKPESIDSSSIRIPPPQGGFNAFRIFSQLISTVITGLNINSNIQINQGIGSNQEDLEINRLIGGDKLYAPDAVPDGKGGFSQGLTGYWNKRLSAVNGLPVMCAITFVGTSYTALNGQIITIPTITFEMVMISMKKGKNIEYTDITGRDTGSVKEYISAKDWTIQIRAIITASQNVSDSMTDFYQEGKYPEENMEKIDLLLNAPIAIKVICPYMNNRGINFIVIDDDVDISQIEGEYEAQKMIIPCRSDSPLLIQVGQGQT